MATERSVIADSYHQLSKNLVAHLKPKRLQKKIFPNIFTT